ncbi:MAG TPA: hypothetical protein VN950_03890 [Terriglobales bacterium]|nr:hypothetical protein [Terriglobales bacterium]
MKMLGKLGISLLALLAFAGIASAQKWQNIKNEPSFPVGAIALLTDGTVLLHEEQDGSPQNWFKLTPDNTGNYINGTITPIASLPVINGVQYGPWFFGSEVLPDGRYIIEGGEYNDGSPAWTPLGAIYDPVKNKWTAVKPPKFFKGFSSQYPKTIGDAQSILLPDGTDMQADCCTKQSALLNAKTLTWTATGAGKFDINDEEGWTLLPDGNVLTVDAYVFQYDATGMNSEIYDTAKGTWSSAGSTVVQLWDSACGNDSSATYEVGPAVLRPDGTVYGTGANTCVKNGAYESGHTAIYNTKTKKWSAGPDFPTVTVTINNKQVKEGLDAADAPAALEPDGNVIVMTSYGYGNNFPAVFFEWNGKKLTKLPPSLNAANDASFYGHFLELPTGQLLFSDLSPEVEVFTPKGTYNKAWAPTITSAPASVNVGSTYVIKGTQFSGLSQGGAYGDDFQDNTNYALVRITNNASKHVFYAKTTNPSTYAVQTGALAESTNFTVAADTELGDSSLVVVTNGIPSAPVSITVQK